MPIETDQMQLVRAWLRFHLGNACPVCKSDDFQFQDTAYLRLSSGDGTARPPVERIWVIPVTCGKCAHMVLLNASQLAKVTQDV
jgi:hypothetical protein